MSYSFSAASRKNLAQLDPLLQKVILEAIKYVDFKVLDAQRGRAAQELAFKQGNSRAHFGQSAHNYVPAIAADLFPAPYDWNNLASFKKLALVMKREAKKLGIPIAWGGDWPKLKDMPHYELTPWRTYAKGRRLVGE